MGHIRLFLLPSGIRTTVLSIALACVAACSGPAVGNLPMEPDSERNDSEMNGDDSSDGDWQPYNVARDRLVPLDPPNDTPYPLDEMQADAVKISCEGVSDDGDRVTFTVDAGMARLQVVEPQGDAVIDDEFELSSFQKDNLPRLWISGPDMKISLADNYGCYTRIRVQASLGEDVYEHAFGWCKAHRNSDRQCEDTHLKEKAS